jgi:hypothetical protein
MNDVKEDAFEKKNSYAFEYEELVLTALDVRAGTCNTVHLLKWPN